MRRRILRTILFTTVLAIGLFAVPLAILVERFVDEDALLRVEREAILAARVIPEDFPANSDSLRLPPNDNGIALAVYDLQGRLVTGEGPSTADVTTARALAGATADLETDTERVVAVPVSADKVLIAVIRAQQSTAASDARALRVVLLLGVAAAAVLAVGAAVGWVMAGRLARPVGELRDASIRLGDGDFGFQLAPSDIPEVEQAAVALRATASRLEELIARERSFSADASHQLRTPLAGLRAALETELAFPRDDRERVLREALEDVDRLERTIGELLAIARRSDVMLDRVDVAGLVDDTADAWRGRFDSMGREVIVHHSNEKQVALGHASMIRHALDVLVDNALNHGAGTVQVETGATADSVTVSVSDEGRGFTVVAGETRAEAPSGFGLPLAQRLVEGMSGRLVLHRIADHPRIDIVLRRGD